MDWKAEAEKLKFDDGLSWTEIANRLEHHFPDLSWQQAFNKIRDYLRASDRYTGARKAHTANRPVGVFGDIHLPFEHPNYLRFITDTFKQFGVRDVICTGDIVDHHALSRFQTEPCAKGSYDELDMSIDRLKEYAEAFPKLKICRGNHDDIPERQAATVGIGKRYLKPLNELLEMPKGWEMADEYIVDDVLYKHGLNCLGKDGAINSAINERMSTVIGHSHSFGGVKYSANKRSIIFGMNVGCGIDVAAYAFAYGKNAKFRPTLGCGIVFNSGYAIFVPMGAEYFRSAEERHE